MFEEVASHSCFSKNYDMTPTSICVHFLFTWKFSLAVEKVIVCNCKNFLIKGTSFCYQ